jgi:predicted amidohydrolase YtcJ
MLWALFERLHRLSFERLISDVPCPFAELDTWEKLARNGKVPLRVAGYLRGDLLDRFLDERGGRFNAPVGNFELRGAKYWSDGSIQGMSAALLQPYSCAEQSCGDLLFDRAALTELVRRIDRAGGQCAVHANGDRAIQTVIEAFQTAAAGGRRDARHRVEHLQMASAVQFKELAAIEAAGSIFANHVYYWGDRHRDVFLGAERAARIDPLADAVREGLHFGLHSDCPITPMDPLRTLWTAVTRQTSSGETLGPDQRLTPGQALHALTADSAWLVHAESRRGTLHQGMDADLAVLDTDLLTAPEQDLENVGVAGTMVAGEWVYGYGA